MMVFPPFQLKIVGFMYISHVRVFAFFLFPLFISIMLDSLVLAASLLCVSYEYIMIC